MAEPENQRNGGEGKLFTLSEISNRTGISMPTLQRYKKLYQNRIPSEGQGRKQRYPESALPVFDEIKNENIGKRGRPRKDASAPRPASPAGRKKTGRAAAAKPAAKATRGRKKGSGRAAAAPAAAPARRGGRGGKKAAAPAPASKKRAQGGGNLMTLTQISEDTGISYPTLVRYVRLYSDRLPHEGKGRARRFYPQAVDVFRQLRSESGRGGRKKGSGAKAAAAPRGRGRAAASGAGRPSAGEGILAQRLKAIEKSQEGLEKRFRGFVQSLQKLFR
jgi:hypothetical protein